MHGPQRRLRQMGSRLTLQLGQSTLMAPIGHRGTSRMRSAIRTIQSMTLAGVLLLDPACGGDGPGPTPDLVDSVTSIPDVPQDVGEPDVTVRFELPAAPDQSPDPGPSDGTDATQETTADLHPSHLTQRRM